MSNAYAVAINRGRAALGRPPAFIRAGARPMAPATPAANAAPNVPGQAPARPVRPMVTGAAPAAPITPTAPGAPEKPAMPITPPRQYYTPTKTVLPRDEMIRPAASESNPAANLLRKKMANTGGMV